MEVDAALARKCVDDANSENLEKFCTVVTMVLMSLFLSYPLSEMFLGRYRMVNFCMGIGNMRRVVRS
jgi:hypothetical protein